MIWGENPLGKHPKILSQTIPCLWCFMSTPCRRACVYDTVPCGLKKIAAFELSVFVYLTTIYYSWWLNQQTQLKNMLVKLNHFPNCRAKNQECLKPPARFETNLFPAPEKKTVLVYPDLVVAGSKTPTLWSGSSDEFKMIPQLLRSKLLPNHSRSRTPKPPRGGKASSKDPDQWNN